jgi:hypothetical protein
VDHEIANAAESIQSAIIDARNAAAAQVAAISQCALDEAFEAQRRADKALATLNREAGERIAGLNQAVEQVEDRVQELERDSEANLNVLRQLEQFAEHSQQVTESQDENETDLPDESARQDAFDLTAADEMVLVEDEEAITGEAASAGVELAVDETAMWVKSENVSRTTDAPTNVSGGPAHRQLNHGDDLQPPPGRVARGGCRVSCPSPIAVSPWCLRAGGRDD